METTFCSTLAFGDLKEFTYKKQTNKDIYRDEKGDARGWHNMNCTSFSNFLTAFTIIQQICLVFFSLMVNYWKQLT